ncbi:unnamed protein product [Trichobilharzia szidati]|nr:unnamed protein product [Trichobilharzia szidati]
MKKLGLRFWKVKMNKLSRHKIPGITPEEQLLTRYIFLTGLMIFITMIITICIATITTIRRKYADNYIPVMYFFIGIIPILVLILVKKLQYLINGYGAAGCIFCAACVMLAISLGLFLTGQCLKLISSLKMAQIVLLWFPFITWIQVIIFFFSICAIYICI